MKKAYHCVLISDDGKVLLRGVANDFSGYK